MLSHKSSNQIYSDEASNYSSEPEWDEESLFSIDEESIRKDNSNTNSSNLLHQSALSRSPAAYQKLRELVENNPESVNQLHSRERMPPIYYAAARGTLVNIKYLISKNANIDAREYNHGNLLWVAVTNNNRSVYEYLSKPEMLVEYKDGTLDLHAAIAVSNYMLILDILTKTPYKMLATNAHGQNAYDWVIGVNDISSTGIILYHPASNHLSIEQRIHLRDRLYSSSAEGNLEIAMDLTNPYMAMPHLLNTLNLYSQINKNDDDIANYAVTYLVLAKQHIKLMTPNFSYAKTCFEQAKKIYCQVETHKNRLLVLTYACDFLAKYNLAARGLIKTNLTSVGDGFFSAVAAAMTSKNLTVLPATDSHANSSFTEQAPAEVFSGELFNKESQYLSNNPLTFFAPANQLPPKAQTAATIASYSSSGWRT